MHEFHAESWFEITLKGSKRRVAAIKEFLPDSLWDPNQLKSEIVRIDGVLYTVAAVETYSIPRSPEHPYRKSFGIMVV